MNDSKAYGEWLSNLNWDVTGTYRPHYKLNETNTNRIMERVFNKNPIQHLFWVLEPDREPNYSHCHLIVKYNYDISSISKKWLRTEIAKSANPKDLKSLSYFERIDSNTGISNYVSKHIGKNALAHNFYTI